MTLTPRLLRLALYCASEELNARIDPDNPKQPGPQPWNGELVRALELEVATAAMSGAGHESEAAGTESEYDAWISTAEAAEILGWHIRKVRRRAADLEARKVAGTLTFRESVVRAWREVLSDDGRLAG